MSRIDNSKLTVCLSFMLVGQVALNAAAVNGEDLQFNRDIRPILSEHCFECHGPDANKRQAELRLDLRASAIESAIIPGDADSDLIQRILTDDPDSIMPPPDAKKPLSEKQVAALKQWVSQGAAYQKHWSLMPIERPAVPGLHENAIDGFIQAALPTAGLSPAPLADRRALIRRVSLDLIGLPPTPAEIDAFLADNKPGAYSRVVDRLLASRHYGEHMALPWLEAARYADTSGYQADWERFMWPWRNWVIDAFNANMPFDQFTIEQLAGDMLPNPTRSQILATGFNRNHRINDEGGVIAAEYAVEYVVDRVDTTSTVWLGLTMGCCRCHDHKYDPLPQQDFYNMFALFNNVPEKGKDGRLGYSLPILDYPNPSVESKIQQLQQSLAASNAALVKAARKARTEYTAWKGELKNSLSEASKPQWSAMTFANLKGLAGVSLTKQTDGSVLASGANPAKPRYTATVNAKSIRQQLNSQPLTGIRLEALTDDSHAGKSLARSSNGNFVLTELTITVVRGKKKTPVKIRSAIADYSQPNFGIAGAIDGNAKTGWAVDGGTKREQRTAVLILDQPLTLQANDRLQIQMRHDSQFGQHAIGRFRLSATSATSPSLDGQVTLPPLVLAAVESDQPADDQLNALNKYFRETHPRFAKLRGSRAKVQKQIDGVKAKQFVKVMVMGEMKTPRETFVLNRGEYDQPDKQRPATPNIPTVFGKLPDGYKANRLGFAKWLVSQDNPLTARVTVNRFWQAYFGRGLVPTVEDFGSQGIQPTHPELLDWLASEFRDSGWDIKAFQKLIVMSDTYRQSSVVRSEHLAIDPENKLLARSPRLRLSGYQLRDQALAASGLLVRKFGGPSVKPYQPAGLWSEFSFQSKSRSTDFYIQDHGEKLYRRGLYTFWKRSSAPPMLANFDAAAREMCSVRSNRTSTPLQALNLMNDVTFVEAARAIGQRMLKEGGADSESRIRFALRLVGAAERPAAMTSLQGSYAEYRKYFANDAAATKEFLANGEWKHDEQLDAVELAALSAVASVILNLDEVVVRQ